MMLSRTDSRAARRRGGFTLVEMLIAMALTIIFGAMAVGTLKLGTSLWRSGHRGSAAYDTATVIFNQIDDDLAAAKNQFWNKDADAFDTRIKFWVDWDAPTAINADRQRLRFVRAIPEGTLNPRIRQAGDGVDNDGDGNTDEELYNLADDDGDGKIDEDLMPLGGLCEVAYVMGLDQKNGTKLYRGVLAPIGMTPGSANDPGQTFFDPDTFATAARISGDASVPVQAKAQPLAENVLYFEVRCWSQYTTTWDDNFAFKVWPSSFEPIRSGPVFWWDSDRLDPAAAIWSPDFVMDWNEPGFTISGDHDGDGTPDSQDEDYVDGNVFPRAIMVVVCVTPPDNLGPLAPMTLAADVSDTQTTITVKGNLPNYNAKWPYLRIGDEWIRFKSFDSDTQRFDVTGGRGARATDNMPHFIGDRVQFGYTFSRVFFNPASRDYWGD